METYQELDAMLEKFNNDIEISIEEDLHVPPG